MNDRSEEEIISLLQDNLSAIRKIAGWTTEELGNKIGVTKQTISNLENKKTIMTRTQYIAIGTVLEYEIPSNSNSRVLAYVVDILLNNNKNYSEEQMRQIGKNIEMLAVASAGGMKEKELEEFGEKLGSFTGITVSGTMAADAVTAAAIGAAVGNPLAWLGAILGAKTIKKVRNKKHIENKKDKEKQSN